ncbi:MAG: PadR family transcriptional regulator [Lachnospiraceae bacterium]|nr:PadR family transcriptional regulator [Lachnospiraceae bacterium]
MAKDRKIDVVILGLLLHEDLTGYDIKKRIDSAISFFWKGSFGSIYPALADMEEQGLVKRKKSDNNGGREKIVYGITKKGKDRLEVWLKDEKASNDLKYETLLKLFFGAAGDRKITIRNIEIFEEQIRGNLELLRVYKKNLEKAPDQEDHLHYHLTVSFGIEACEAYLRWCSMAKKTLKER